jgi:hypothetical protein
MTGNPEVILDLSRLVGSGAMRAEKARTRKSRIIRNPRLKSFFSSERNFDFVTARCHFMQSISFSLLMRGVEFGLELRLEAAAGFFELRLSSRHVSQQCVHLLWAQYEQSEYEYEQDFGAQTHDSPLGYVLVVCDGRGCTGRPIFISFHG